MRCRLSAAVAGAVLLLAQGMAAAAAGPLRIATWNLEHLAQRDGAGCKPRQADDYARLRSYARVLDADVVALQEVENAAAARRLFPEGQYHIEVGGAGEVWEPRLCRDQAHGLLTAHRVAFAIRKGVPYRRNADLELPAGGKTSPDITLFPERAPLRLLAVHLRSGCFSNARERRSGEACDALEAQAGAVERWIDGHSADRRPAAVLGDFNRRLTVPGDRLWQDLADGRPAPLASLAEGHRQRCRGPYEGRPYIDHILVNPAARARVAGDFQALVYRETGRRAPSDHCPVWVRVSAPEY